MFVAALRILVVGSPVASTDAMINRLELRGWGSYGVQSVSEAKEVMQTIQFDVVLAAERLPDGQGYDLMDGVGSCSGSLLVCVSLSESCLWLAVIEEGERVLGKRAVNQHMLELELEHLLCNSAKKRATDESGARRASAKRVIPPRRRVDPPHFGGVLKDGVAAPCSVTSFVAHREERPLLRAPERADETAPNEVRESAMRARASK